MVLLCDITLRCVGDVIQWHCSLLGKKRPKVNAVQFAVHFFARECIAVLYCIALTGS